MKVLFQFLGVFLVGHGAASVVFFPNDPLFGTIGQYALHSETPGFVDIDAPEAWTKSRGDCMSTGIRIGVIDSGMYLEHPDLSESIWTNPGEIPGDGIDNDGNGYVDDHRGYNTLHNNGNVNDGYGHGTQVAGIIGARGHNEIGMTGVCLRVSMVPIRIFDNNGWGTLGAHRAAINYANQTGIQITNQSLGYSTLTGSSVQMLRNRVIETNDAGNLIIAAAGNGSWNGTTIEGRNIDNDSGHTPFHPASFNFRNIISVTAVFPSGQLSSFTNFGPIDVDLAAPGSVNLSTRLPNQDYPETDDRHWYGRYGWASIATPHVAAAAALIWTYYPELSHHEVRTRVLRSTDPDPSLEGKVLSGGRLNLNKELY